MPFRRQLWEVPVEKVQEAAVLCAPWFCLLRSQIKGQQREASGSHKCQQVRGGVTTLTFQSQPVARTFPCGLAAQRLSGPVGHTL